MKEERDRVKDEKYITLMENRKEAIKLKRKQVALKEQELQQRYDIAEKKLNERKALYAEVVDIEKRKYRMLKIYLDNKENRKDRNVSSDSD